MNFLQVGDATLHYRAEGLGTGKPVIAFVNSLGTDIRIWDAVVAALAGDYAVVLHDKRGHGLSTAGAAPITIETHAADLLALLDHLGVERAVIWGLSVGGLIAQAVHGLRPELVAALVLSNTAHKIGTAEMWNARIAAIRADGLSSLIDTIMERWFTPAFRRADNALYAGCRAMLAGQPVDGYCGTCAAIRDADFTTVVAGIAVPTLCVGGDQDGSTPPALVRSLSALIPGSRYVEISDCGHIPCVEQPAAYAAAVRAFLADLTLPGSGTADRSARYAKGMVTRRSVLGDVHVDRANAAATAFDQPFQTLITEAAWGTVWSGEQWTKRERSMVTIALLAALGHDDEVAMHVRATANTGASEADIREALLHVAIYAGVPAANHAFKIAKQALAALDAAAQTGETT